MIKSRLIGSGFIGGKAIGMLLARKILENDDPEYWKEKLEAHDSFYIAVRCFYTYIFRVCGRCLLLNRRKKSFFISLKN